LVIYQIGALAAFAHAAGTRLSHVKPHGALYNMAARDAVLAEAIAQAIVEVDAGLILVGLASSELPTAGQRLGLRVAHEAFADRRYEADGRLSPRGEPGAVIDDIDTAVAQALAIAIRGEATARTGETLRIRADTLCVHGDRADAGEFARRLRRALEASGVEVRALKR
ncbi:MAG TPA: LamB/YcsF family protein, partial [Dokdonella sp.]|nr:LamB/YcsF family protein [Dokdonella sp.]